MRTKLCILIDMDCDKYDAIFRILRVILKKECNDNSNDWKPQSTPMDKIVKVVGEPGVKSDAQPKSPPTADSARHDTVAVRSGDGTSWREPHSHSHF